MLFCTGILRRLKGFIENQVTADIRNLKKKEQKMLEMLSVSGSTWKEKLI